LQVRMCGIYADVLGLNAAEVGIDDDFFRLGGNSILAIKLIHRINKSENIQVKIIDIYKYKTIRNLCDNYRNFNNLLIRKLIDGGSIDIFMIHSGDAGVEVYESLSKELIPKCTSWGIDSYNMYNTPKISNLQILAKLYLSFVLKENRAKHDPIVLLGWSLGGQIALEMAYMLEQLEYRNMIVFLLDTLLSDGDQKIISIRNEYLNYLKKCEPKTDRDEMIIANNKLLNQSISGKLEYTKIILFKAMKFVKNDPKAKHIKFQKMNNVENVVHSTSQLSVIEIPNANHYTILNHPRVIGKKILEKLK